MRESHSGRFDNIFGMLCLLAATLIAVFGDWHRLRKPILLGFLLSLPWALLIKKILATDSEALRTIALIIGLGCADLFSYDRKPQESVVSGELPSVCFVAVVIGVGWLWARLAARVKGPNSRPQRD